ncbi:ComEC/Rec2 family competence protein [Candidatus Giovannonibacteria bacterium]|nr:ComEC/Rec2 family competence protein [Candidatus Giovannonibacteria bacterium]
MRKFGVSALLGFFLGVAFRSFFPVSGELFLLSFSIAIVFALIVFLNKNFSVFIIWASFFLIAFSLGGIRYEVSDSRENISELHGQIGEKFEVSGVVVEDPEFLDKYTRAIFKTDAPFNGKILLSLPHYPEVNYGDRLKISGTLKEPENFEADGVYIKWKEHLAKDNIYYEMSLPAVLSKNRENLSIGEKIKQSLFTIKHKFLQNLSRVIPEPHNSFLAGITIGERASLPQDLKEGFKKVGIMHLVVLSGYNISIVSDYIMKFLGYLPISKILQAFIATGGIILFATLTGGSATVVRAAIMGILLLWARESGKIYEAMVALLFAAFLMVFVNPKILRFDTSFQLSFLATAGLIILSARLDKILRFIPNFWKLRENLVSTLSAQIFVMPLLISIGGKFTWATIPANLLILSAIPLTMFFGFMAGLFGFISYYISWVFSFPAYILLAYELWIVKIFS